MGTTAALLTYNTEVRMVWTQDMAKVEVVGHLGLTTIGLCHGNADLMENINAPDVTMLHRVLILRGELRRLNRETGLTCALHWIHT